MQETPTRERSRALPLTVGIILLVTAVAQVITILEDEPEPPVLLRLRLQEGHTVSYRTEVSMEGRVSAGLIGQPFEVRMVTDQDWVVQEVAEDDSVTIEIDTTIVDVTSRQGAIPRSEFMGVEGTSTMRLAADGTILDASLGVTGSVTGPATVPGLEGLGPTFPDHPVVPGDSWDLSEELPLLPGGPSLQISGEAELDGYEEVAGVRSAVIVSDALMPFDFELDLAELADEIGDPSLPEGEVSGTIVYEGEMTMSSRQWVDPGTGLQVRAEGDGQAEIAFSLPDLPQNGDMPAIPRTQMEFELSMTLERR